MPAIAVFLLSIATTETAAPPKNPAAVRPMCENVRAILATGPAQKISMHPLTQEPPARQIKAVVRTIDGCQRPIVVRAEVGKRDR